MQSKKNYIKGLALLIFAGLILFGQPDLQAQSILPSLGSDRSGTSGFQFTKIGIDPRSAAMGYSNVADAADGSSLYWNPALAAEVQSSEVFLSHTSYFADINMEYAAYVQKVGSFSIGGSIQYLNSGEINETTEFAPLGTGRTFSTVHMNAGLTVAQKLTGLFSYGITARYYIERIEEVEIQTGGIDLGLFYRVGDSGLRFAIGVNNFGLDADPTGSTTATVFDQESGEFHVEEIEEFRTESLPTTFNLGAAYNVYERGEWVWTLTGQVTNPSDNSERMSLGSEVGYMDRFYLRTGYQFGLEEYILPSIGAGFDLPISGNQIGVDYSFTTFERLGSIQRVAMRINL